MIAKTYDVDTYHRYKGKNWLGSEVGFLSKTIQVDDTATTVEEDGRKIVKSGTIFTAPFYGLLLNDIDVTDGAKPAGLMIRGSYIDANLPVSASAYATNFEKQGLYAIVEPKTTRPDFGTIAEIAPITAPNVNDANGTLSWSSIPNAVGYAIYKSSSQNGSYEFVAEVDTTSYAAKTVGYYKVKALGDNINHGDSEFSTAVNVTTAAMAIRATAGTAIRRA